MKVCTKCKIEKPFDEFYKDKSKKDELDCYCKICKEKMKEKYYKKLKARNHMEIPTTKVCPNCNKEKPSYEFRKNKSAKNGLDSRCKSCKKENDKEYRQKLASRTSIEIPKTKKCCKCNIEKPSDNFYICKTMKDGLDARCKSCNRKQKEQLSKRTHIEIPKTKKCSKCNKEKPFNEFSKNKSRLSGLNSECKKCKSKYQSSEKAKKLANKRHKNRYKNDEIYRLSKNLRNFVRRSIKLAKKSSNEDIKKSKKSLEYIGCTIEELKNHLENQFYPHPETGEEMTWENHAFEGWHVDHIKPLSTFDLTSEKEIMKANHYKNLQPLWAEENLSKNNKYEE